MLLLYLYIKKNVSNCNEFERSYKNDSFDEISHAADMENFDRSMFVFLFW